MESCTFIHGPGGPDAATVPVNDALHSRQADARTFEFTRGMEALKGAE